MIRKGVPQGPKRQQLSLFGQYVTLLCQVLHASQAEVSRHTTLSASTISKATKVSDRRLEEETVKEIWQGFLVIAEQRGMTDLLDASMQESFYNAAHCASSLQISRSQERLHSLLVLVESDRGKRRP